MKISISVVKLRSVVKVSIFLALLVGGNGLMAMESVIPLQPHKKWQYAKTTFKFKCVDSASDKDVIEVPGNLVHYSKSLTLMIDDIGGDPTVTIPLFHTTKECFKRIIHALEILVDHQKTYKDLLAYYGSLTQPQLLECILNINFLDIQPLLLPALEVLQQTLVQSPSDILTWKLGLPTEILALLKNSALESLNATLSMCNLNISLSTVSFSATALNQDGRIIAFGQWNDTIQIAGLNQPIILQGHTGSIQELQFSPDSQKIASASVEDQTVRLWDIATEQEIVQFKNLSYHPYMQFSSDNNYFACLEYPEEQNNLDETYALINRKTGQMHMLPGVEGFINNIAVSPDGKQIAIAADKVYLWNTQTRELMPLEVEQQEVLSMNRVVFSQDGTLLAFYGMPAEPTEHPVIEIIFWNMTEMKINAPLSKIITGTIPSKIVFSADSSLMAFDDGEDVQVLDVQKDEPVKRLGGHTIHVHSIEFTPDNKHIITAAHDDIIRITNLSDGKERKLVRDGTEVVDDVYPVDSNTLLSISEEGSVYIWDIVTGQSKKLASVFDATEVNAISPDKTLIAVNAKGGKINLVNIKTGELRIFTQGIGSLIECTFSTDGQSLLALYANGTVLLWDIKTGMAQKIIGTPGKIINKAYCVGNGDLVLVGEKIKNFINLYDIKANVTHQLTAHSNDVERLAFSPDGQYLISSGQDYMIKIWDVATQKVIKQFNMWVDSFAISPDGKTLVVDSDKHVYLIDLSTHTQQILTTHANPEESSVQNMLFNADGSLLAIHRENTIELWDMNTHTLKNVIKDPVNSIVRYFFVPNTTLLVIVGEESVVFWDCYTNNAIFTDPMRCRAQSVSTSGDGSKVVMSGSVVSQGDDNGMGQTTVMVLNQRLVKAIAKLSFEQVFIIARALHGMRTGTLLDLSNSPELLDIFNQIDHADKLLLEQCFKIKTAQ